MLATLVEEPPPAKAWLFEPKLDGFRALAFRDGAKVRLLSRNKKDLGGRFPEIVEALGRQPVEKFILDGEVVALNNEGVSSFSLLQQRLTPISLAGARQSKNRLYYYVFDLLFANGYDTRHLPQSERSKLLAQGVVFRDPIRPTEVLTGEWRELLDDACGRGWEGLIAKQADSPYVGGRTRHWVTLKCNREQEFVIGGWTDPEGSRAGFGSLLVGYYARGDLLYAGKVGTGFSDRTLSEMSKRLRTLARETSPFKKDAQIPRKGVHFVEPRLVASIGFTEWTHDEHIRHPRFRGLRDDRGRATCGAKRPNRGEWMGNFPPA